MTTLKYKLLVIDSSCLNSWLRGTSVLRRWMAQRFDAWTEVYALVRSSPEVTGMSSTWQDDDDGVYDQHACVSLSACN